MFIAGCEVPLRHSHTVGDRGNVLLMPAWQAGKHLGVKTVAIFPGNGAIGLPAVHAVYALFDALTGVPLALMDGSELTARRTAAASALAADFLARSDATHLLVVGAGRVAALLPAALCSVRPGLSQVTLWNRSPQAAHALAARLRVELRALQREPSVDVQATSDLESAVRSADIVSCATLASAPLIHGEWLAPGSHLDLIGSYTPTMREADGLCLAQARVFVDTEEALAKAGDVLQAVAEGHFDPADLQGTLSSLCRGERPGRSQRAEITLFKAVGSALEDLAAAELALAAPDNASPIA